MYQYSKGIGLIV
ncbi:hypothetical protein F383_24586 [Gossypium arboreum]|uniref:Uncharacterized protein n=1 Tax=Gossypium arboreum TaxID=29729 RepID=A0A0B0MAH2_GOSAR|nr:hypothetical protein F383_36887 [Gossypium arboreum]KHG02835.1 hypothetical protein F383_24586 [Gossypium arboreum]